MSRDGTYLAVAGLGGAEVIRRADGRRVAALGPSFQSVGFAADGTLFPQTAAIWRFRTPGLTMAGRRDLPGGPVEEIAVSPDSASVAPAQGQKAPVLRVEDLAPVRTVGEHPAPLSRVAWSPDGRLVATATDTDTDTDTDTVRLDTGVLAAEVRANSNQRGEIAFTPDGTTLAAGADDWTVTRWHLEPDDAVRRVCALLVTASRHGGDPLPDTCPSR
ncbi:WD40 repeat domain-containing protein [Actinoplanes derwentensis]|uniref:Uncharacterized protein n=1 Tax=Actinoplanes derwentensis TaxID=113562 RepID=A0A1H1X281_9ACTN|nr:hypothetical protein [Actinoplanes derwentensis]GID85765.1 hypothetical protein Ade03nite_46890 [Actinoplanes derwentensis]SDT02659.1 hypothetical protein SAMN04489716_2293 [Actinoplanes derwentensis]